MKTREAFTRHYPTLARRGVLAREQGRAIALRSLERAIAEHLPATAGAALDVGCGEGLALALLRARGFTDLAGFDASPDAVRAARAHGFGFVTEHDARDLDSFRPGRCYDLICAIDVLEHLPKDDALPFVASARDRLAPGGRLLIQTPNMGGVLASLHRHDDLTHEWGVTERSMTDLMRAAGFGPAEVSVHPAWSATTGAGRAREWYLRALHAIVTASEGSARPRIPTPNLIGVGVKR